MIHIAPTTRATISTLALLGAALVTSGLVVADPSGPGYCYDGDEPECEGSGCTDDCMGCAPECTTPPPPDCSATSHTYDPACGPNKGGASKVHYEESCQEGNWHDCHFHCGGANHGACHTAAAPVPVPWWAVDYAAAWVF